MVRTFFCLIAIWLFVSCSFSPEPEYDNRYLRASEQQQIKNNDGTPIEWPKGWPKEGFQFNENLTFYGFDISPNYPYVTGKTLTKEDSIAYVSIPRYGDTRINVFTDSGYAINYDYYYCDPDNYKPIFDSEIPAQERQKHELIIDEKLKEKIALCKSFDGNIKKIQELHTNVYDWKDYNFQTYILGNVNANEIRHNLIKNNFFWSQYDRTYNQAIVKRGITWNSYKETGGYVFVRARGNYGDGCVDGDITRLMKEIDSNVVSRKIERRIMIQLGYPIKVFWPLEKKGNGEIDLCGTPYTDLKRRVNLSLKTLVSIKGCSNLESDVYVAWNDSKEAWVLTYSDGKQEIATEKNVNTKCAVFASVEDSDNSSIEEIPEGNVAITKNTYGSKKAAISILPWLGDMTTKIAIHELGHTMGLTDVNDAFLSSKINNESKEGNLMHPAYLRKGYRLRYRGMVPMDDKEQNINGCSNKVGGKCVEIQWDCLHKKQGSCLVPTLDPYLR